MKLVKFTIIFKQCKLTSNFVDTKVIKMKCHDAFQEKNHSVTETLIEVSSIHGFGSYRILLEKWPRLTEWREIAS